MLITFIIIAIALTFLALILTIIWLLKESGLFTSIKIKIVQPSFESLTIAYKFQQGDYSKAADIFKIK
jgi:Na+/H+ antiporter NhaD/arsenite permease-like protein